MGSNIYMERIRVNPNMSIISIRQNIDEVYNTEMSRTTTYNATTYIDDYW